ncbi:thioredoxin [candidate division WOR-3 bacterium]|nr:thioredoxin [candidate division WOR-3 bacterium]
MAEIKLTDANFKTEIQSSELPVFVDFWAPWCMPCQIMAPIVEKLAKEYEGKVKVCKLNVEEGPKTAAEYGIRGIPTSIIFKNGKQVEQMVGALPEAEFKKKLDAVISNEE